jgi:hypothetical protein
MIDGRYMRVLPDATAAYPGFYGVWIKDTKVWGRAFSDKQAALNFANAMVGRSVDLFFGMSLQSETKPPKKNKRGRIVLPAEKQAALAVLLKAWWLDIDLKDGYFASTEQALKEVAAWMQAAGIPPPSLIVFTGSGGFHLYWILDEAVPRAVWEPLAWALRAAASMHFKPRPNPKGGRDLTLDFGLTTDAGRILRVPGSFNHNSTPAKLVEIKYENRDYTLAEVDKFLTPHKMTYTPSVTRAPAAKRYNFSISPVFAGVPLPGPLDAGVTSYVPEIEDVIRGGCDFIKVVHASGGAGIGEQLWRETIRLAFWCQDGAEVAHELSDGWTGNNGTYDPADVDDKFSKVDPNYGWPQCKQFESLGAAECRGCRHWPPQGKSQSPLNFAIPAAPATATAPPSAAGAPTPTPVTPAKFDLPPSFKQDADGIIYTMVDNPRDPDAPPVRADILPYPILDVRANRPGKAGGQWSVTITAQTTRTDTPSATVSYKEYMDPHKLKDVMGEQGIGFTPRKHTQVLGEFMASFVERLRLSANQPEDTYSLGWHRAKDTGKVSGFVYGGVLHNGVGNRPVSIVDRGLGDLYTPHGTLDEWKKVAGLIFAQRRVSLETIMAMGMGSALMGPSGQYGGIFSSWSPDTGVQKTNATKVTQAFWGDPKAGLGGLNDTPNFVIQRLGALGSLPYCWDDLQTIEDNRKFATFTMQGPQGRSRGRLTRSSQSAPVMTWESIVLVNSNASVKRSIDDVITQTIAGGARIMEQRIYPNTNGLGLISPTAADQMFASLDFNYGHPAAIFTDFLGARWDFVKDCILKVRDKMWNDGGGSNADRFWYTMASSAIVAARFTNHLQLTDFDLAALCGYLPELIQEQRLQRRASTSDLSSPTAIENIVSNYLTFRGDCTLVTDNVRTTPGKAPAGWSVGRINNNSLRHVHVRVSRNDKLMRISLADFENFVKKDRNIGRSVIVDHVIRVLPGVRQVKSDLGQGVQAYETHRQSALEFDLGKYDFFPLD